MNHNDAFDRDVSDWLHADAEHRVPEHLDAVLRRTADGAPAPGMVEPRKVAPRGYDLPPRTGRPGSPGCWSSSALIVALGAARPVRSGRASACRSRSASAATAPSCPATTATSTPSIRRPMPSACSIGGETFDFGPAFSRDGTKFAVPASVRPIPTTTQGLSLVVANADGTSGPRADRTGQEPRLVRLVAGRHADRLHVRDRCRWAQAHQRRQCRRERHHDPRRRPAGPFPVLAAAPRMRRSCSGASNRRGDPPPGIFAVHPDGTGLRQCRRDRRRTTTSIT